MLEVKTIVEITEGNPGRPTTIGLRSGHRCEGFKNLLRTLICDGYVESMGQNIKVHYELKELS